MALTQIPIELSSTPGIVDNSNATAITIDSSENVLVGTTDAAPGVGNTNTGGAFGSNGYGVFSRTGAAAQATAYFNKNTNDGTIIALNKDGTTVGSIGAYDGRPYLASTTVGIRISNALFPSNTSGVITDGAMNIGGSSGRFKDLYLSGGVVFGDAGGSGTSTSNSLDSYEEGTFTPTSGVSLTVNYAKYTKIGRVVYINVDYQVSSGSSSSSMFYNTLPFTPLDDYSAGSFNYQTTTYDDATVNIEPSGVFFRNEPDTANMTYAQAAGRRFIYSAWYHTNA